VRLDQQDPPDPPARLEQRDPPDQQDPQARLEKMEQMRL
jgi:hypothetical protein